MKKLHNKIKRKLENNPLLQFDGFSYVNNVLSCEDTSLSLLAEKFGTPTYVYSHSAILNRIHRLKTKNCKIYFSVKACSNIHILKIIKDAGCGVDVVSGGELYRALKAGLEPSDILFSGVGKTQFEIKTALDAGVTTFVVESLSETQLLNALSKSAQTRSKVIFRINPNIDAKTHPHITTGLKNSKFGFSSFELQECFSLLKKFNAIQPIGLSTHIGSQILTEKPFLLAWKYLLQFLKKVPFSISHLDLGGGLGISYQNETSLTLEAYSQLISKTFISPTYTLSIQPGRSLVGPTGVLLTRIVHKKIRGKKIFYILDSAMNDLLRPALYNAIHPILTVQKNSSKIVASADLVGPVCESADSFQRNCKLPVLEPDSLLAFGNAGAYGMSMSSQYNSRPRGAEVLVSGDTYKLIRQRESYENLIERELV